MYKSILPLQYTFMCTDKILYVCIYIYIYVCVCVCVRACAFVGFVTISNCSVHGHGPFQTDSILYTALKQFYFSNQPEIPFLKQ
jgi:hypothetical protein